MLSPKYLEDAPENMVRLYAQAEEDILSDMARRIAKYDYFIPAVEHQLRMLEEMGAAREYVFERLSSIFGKSEKELKALFRKAAEEACSTDAKVYRSVGLDPPELGASEALRRRLNSGLANTKQAFVNLTRTTAQGAYAELGQALDRAWMQVSTGGMDANTAIRSAVKWMSARGVDMVHYDSGAKATIEAAVRRAVVTGVNQMALGVQWELADEMDSDLVEVTAHAGARPEHAAWQGKIYSRSGKHPKYPDFRKSTGYGTGAGLGGWNCRHSFFPYFDGSPRTYSAQMLKDYSAKSYAYNGRKLTEYEASQKQRYIERQIRRWKRENAAMQAAGLDDYESAVKVRQWQERQKDFLQQTGLKRQAEREQVHKFGYQEKAFARRTLAKYEKYRYNQDGTIVVTDDWKSKGKVSIPKSYRPHAVIETTTEFRNGIAQTDRTIYDADGMMVKQIHSGPHNREKMHPFGMHGEHAHDYKWLQNEKKPNRTVRDVSDTERTEHADILGGESDE
ncbi:MAG: phage minor capsid protein [Clostridiaceae bacterium]|nr:phage minor capsid protein [Clostridiaceae bacterium]